MIDGVVWILFHKIDVLDVVLGICPPSCNNSLQLNYQQWLYTVSLLASIPYIMYAWA